MAEIKRAHSDFWNKIESDVLAHESRIAALEKGLQETQRILGSALPDVWRRTAPPLPPAVARVVECAVEWHKALVGMKAPPEQALSDAVAAYKETLR